MKNKENLTLHQKSLRALFHAPLQYCRLSCVATILFFEFPPLLVRNQPLKMFSGVSCLKYKCNYWVSWKWPASRVSDLELFQTQNCYMYMYITMGSLILSYLYIMCSKPLLFKSVVDITYTCTAAKTVAKLISEDKLNLKSNFN